jgi:outer membrane protein OmpA-like peptidoglycan-associated protein
MKKIIFSAFLSLAGILPAGAQDFLGYINSNYSGVTGTDLNPANVVDSRYKVDVTLAGISFSLANNYIGLKKEALKRNGSLFDFSSANYPNFNDSLFKQKYLVTRDGGKNKSVYISNQIYLPSFMVSINHKNAIALKWKVRTLFNVDGVEPKLATLIFNDLNYPSLWSQTIDNKLLSVQTMTWAEYGLSYGHVFKDDGPHYIKAGATVKLLQGLQAAYMYVKDLHYELTDDTTLSVFHSDVSYGHSTNYDLSNGGLAYKYVSNPGVGFDFGVVYEWRPEADKYKYDMDGQTGLWRNDQNKYKLKVGISATDIGTIKFKKGQMSHNFTADIGYWNLHEFDSISSIPEFDTALVNHFGKETSDETFKMNLPTAISAQIDYNIYKDFYVNFMPYWAWQWKKDGSKVHDLTTFTLAPRWDHKWFGAFIPISYDMTGNTRLGLDVRLGPLILGMNNIIPLISKKEIYTADFHVLLKVPIMYGKPKDKDKDKVSDKKDLCKEVPGVWEFMGCPDRDGDHIQDNVDACPDEPGLPEFQGCPDRDGDKIIDKQDACPDDAGLAEFNGCPDKDGDKIIDKEDECPDQSGLPQFKGCPDRDGDGIQDKLDLCPDKQGPERNDGCPEVLLSLIDSQGNVLRTVSRNKDGNFSFDDLPADELVIFKLEGEDTDSIKEVKVIVGGIAKKAIRDSKDRFFRFIVLKTDTNKLNPMDNADVAIKLNQEEAEVLKKAFDNLEFATAKDVIKQESLSSLDELAGLMAKKPNWRLKISGHTDNQGKAVTNMKLSEKRAKAVMNYLVSKGIAADRFKVEWFGSKKPIADNKTEAGRQKNRRVEMLIIE